MPKEIEIKSVLNKKKQRDSWFLDDYTLNLYQGCSFNCLYCYIRGSKYGLNLAKSLTVKTNALEVLEKQLHNRAKKQEYGIIVLSSVTDPYPKIEKERQLTRQALELILNYKFPVHILTKSDLIERDFDLIKKIDQTAILPKDLNFNRGAVVSFSFSTIDNEQGKIFEPGATLPSKRLETLEKTLNQNLFAGVSLMPLLPHIKDTGKNLELLFSTFSKIGVNYIFPTTLTLFGNGKTDSKTLIINAISKHYPELLAKYKKFFTQTNEMPLYYRNAFQKKTEELAKKYGLKTRIVK